MTGRRTGDGVVLCLLGGLSWQGRPVPGGRGHALLAALALRPGAAIPDGLLADQVWAEDQPASPAKALQVLVSRLRSQLSREVVRRTPDGYRLGIGDDAVDALALRDLVQRAQRAEAAGDPGGAARLAGAALEIEVPASAEAAAGSRPDHPVETLRTRARAHRASARAVAGRALAAVGDHAVALPLLEAETHRDEATLAALLRSEAAVRGAPAALRTYEAYRSQLRRSLGVDPGPRLREVHAALLAADDPVRAGLRHDSTSLVGRDRDLRALRALVGEARVISIVGAGGLGKTRLAHVVGREAPQPVVHFVELVGVSSSDDVIAEVGSALGVRDSVSGRRVLTPAQRHDVRSRIAQVLDGAPALVILDNCEHVVEAVADLVAFLVATAPRLHVVTTTRAPLAIAAERVYWLGQLDDQAAADLFGQRARAARAEVRLDDGAVRRVVGRLDGLPLAVELAAAKVRAMSVAEIDRRLDDRFALLRGGDRTAPDRHQTLLAVIDWSWNLLAEPERRALRWLSVFHDGFSLDAACRLLGHDALGEVGSLVDQSLLTLDDRDGAVRYRMLETVREFGRVQLTGAGEESAARERHLDWACAYAAESGARLWSVDQVAAVEALRCEESNLADCLRLAVAAPDPDPARTVRLLGPLSTLWTVTGENPRVIAVAGAVEAAMDGWTPPAQLVDPAVEAAAMLAMNTMAGLLVEIPATMALLEHHADAATSARTRGIVTVMRAQDPSDPDGTVARLCEIGRTAERPTAVLALMWEAHHRENSGDPEGALVAAARGLELAEAEDGPWLGALLRTISSTLLGQLGRHAEAAAHAVVALPALEALGADDDAAQVRALLATHAMEDGRLEDAEREIAHLERLSGRRTGLVGSFVVTSARAELALARGDVATGLSLHRAAIAETRDIRFPGLPQEQGLEPWTLFAESIGLTASAVHGRDADGADLHDLLRAKAARVLDPQRGQLDFPVAGLVLHALGAWSLLRETVPVEDAVRLLALAERFAYARLAPTLGTRHTVPAAEARAPGLLDRVRGEYAGRRGPDLLPEARAVTARLPAR